MPLMQKWFFDVRKRYNSKNIKEIDKDFKLQSTHTPWDNWEYHHTTIWRLANMDKDDITLDDLLKLSLAS